MIQPTEPVRETGGWSPASNGDLWATDGYPLDLTMAIDALLWDDNTNLQPAT